MGSPVKIWLALALLFVGLYGGYTGWRLYKLDRERSAAAGYGGAEYRPPEDLDYPIGPFELTERSGAKFNSEALRGKVWVASFFFTACPGPCVVMNNVIAKLQREVPADVVFVSVTVDPENDTPEKLQRYAAHYEADPERWVFLTGEMADIERLAVEEFKVLFARANHSDRLVVVDRRGRVRAAYSSSDPADVLLLKRKLAELLEEPPEAAAPQEEATPASTPAEGSQGAAAPESQP